MKTRGLMRAMTSAILISALILAACKSPVSHSGKNDEEEANVSFRFIVHRTADHAAKLLLDNAATLTVTLTIEGAPTPTATSTVDIAASQTTATVSFPGLAYGTYTVLAIAKDAAGNIVARQESTATVGETSQSSIATLYMLPASITDAASAEGTTDQQELAGEATLAEGEVRTWIIPELARYHGKVAFDLGETASSVLAYLQDGNGVLLNVDPATRTGKIKNAPAGPIYLTLYNSGEAAALSLRLNIQLQLFFDGGEGTSDSPYLISDADGLTYLSQTSARWNDSFQQTEDIDLGSVGSFSPIGTSVVFFKGNYDGRGFAISNLTISGSGSMNQGLFGYISAAALTSIKIKGASVSGKSSVGALAGRATNSTISGCSAAEVAITATADAFGGLVGQAGNDTSISGCSASGTVTTTAASGGNIGGLVGYLNASTVSACSAAVDVSIPVIVNSVGGLVGQCYGGTIETSSSTGNVTGGGDYVGGLVGSLNTATVSNCYSRGGTVTCSTANRYTTAGFAYVSSTSTITNCYAANKIVLTKTGATKYGFAYISISTSYTPGGCFWDSEVSETTSGSNQEPSPTAKTTADMLKASTFTDAGWSTDIWNLVDGAYPTLK